MAKRYTDPWDTRLPSSIRIKPDGPTLTTLADVRSFVVKLPEIQQSHPNWLSVAERLLKTTANPTPPGIALTSLVVKNALLMSAILWEEID